MNRWLRPGLVALGLPQLVTGVWAVISPAGWYESFPGFGTALVAADGPYNAHLAADAGAGFLATGLVLLLAVVGEPRTVRLAVVGYVAFAIPHLVYHVGHRSHGLPDAQNLLNTIVLAVAVAMAVLLLWATEKEIRHEAASQDAGVSEGAAPRPPEPYGPAPRAGKTPAAGSRDDGVRDGSRLQ
jgi:hypothetical protein